MNAMTSTAQRLAHCRVMLLFTPDLVPGVESPPGAESDRELGLALAALEAALAAPLPAGDGPAIGALQLRIKSSGEPAFARATMTWASRLLDLLAGLEQAPLLLINDRVDVALALGGVAAGVAGVHLGQADLPLAAARQLLGPHALLGRSTHDFAQVLVATEEGANYLGFGPIHPTTTKGYARGLGAEQAWIASAATGLPLFPIGGIQTANASELAEVGRAAVSSAILGASDPCSAAAAIAAALTTS